MQIRSLKTKDIFTVLDMLQIVAGKGSVLTKLISSKKEITSDKPDADDEGRSVQIGLTVLSECYTATKDKCIKWFADLVNVTVEEYLDLPINTTNEIIDHLVNSQDAKDFFINAWKLFKTTRLSSVISK